MKPVVSSLIALAIGIAPLSALASEKSTHALEPPSTRIVKHGKKAPASAVDKSGPRPVVRVKHKAGTKPAVHHAHAPTDTGPGHAEPKPAVINASMKAPHSKTSHAKRASHAEAGAASKSSEMPRLPAANGSSKHGHEKGARKPATKKNESADKNDGQLQRDEEFAELVARIRGIQSPTEDNTGKGKTSPSTKPCIKDPVEIVRGPEVERFELVKCDGSIAPGALEHLSILVRPGSAPRPTATIDELSKKPGPDIAKGVRRVDPRLVQRLAAVVDRFSNPGTPTKMSVISGFRPTSIGSMHATGRAIDFRIEGVKNDDVIAFCKTLDDTGCGFYPNSSFVHLDVREKGIGRVNWIDASGPGESPRYVPVWPPPPMAKHHGKKFEPLEKTSTPIDREAALERVDEHPGEVAP